MVNDALYTAAIKSLWVDRCTVKVFQDEETELHRTVQTEQVLFADEPCRLSFAQTNVTDESSHAAQRVQSTVLLIDKEREIPPGSIITVTHEGVTSTYTRSGVPAPYSVHQEVPLELKKEWA